MLTRNSQAVTLLEFEGVTKELTKRLTGRNARYHLKKVKKFLSNPDIVIDDLVDVEPWGTLTIGWRSSKDELAKAIGENICSHIVNNDPYPSEFFEEFQLSQVETQVVIVRIPLRYLGLKGDVTFEDLDSKIKYFGFSSFTSEMALELLSHQPIDWEVVCIAMERKDAAYFFQRTAYGTRLRNEGLSGVNKTFPSSCDIFLVKKIWAPVK